MEIGDILQSDFFFTLRIASLGKILIKKKEEIKMKHTHTPNLQKNGNNVHFKSSFN